MSCHCLVRKWLDVFVALKLCVWFIASYAAWCVSVKHCLNINIAKKGNGYIYILWEIMHAYSCSSEEQLIFPTLLYECRSYRQTELFCMFSVHRREAWPGRKDWTWCPSGEPDCSSGLHQKLDRKDLQTNRGAASTQPK